MANLRINHVGGRLAAMAEMKVDQSRKDFEELIHRIHGDLLRLAQRVLRDASEAEDVVQDTLAAVWKQWQVLQPKDPAAYVFRAVSLNAIKRATRRRTHLPLEAAGQVPHVERPSRPDPLAIERALRCLPPAQQSVVRMRFYLGLSLAQIAKSLSISSNTAASRCRYAMRQLRSILHRGHED